MDNDARAKDLDWQSSLPSDDEISPPYSQSPKYGSAPKQDDPGSATDRRRELSKLGQTLVFKGEFEAEEDLIIDGRVEGTITHRADHLTIGPHGDVRADITARRVLVQGRVVGNVRASETIVIEPSARVAGNLIAPRIGLKEGAEFDGNIQMKGAKANPEKSQATEKSQSTEKPQSTERDSRGASAKRSGSAKKASASGTALSDSHVDDMLE